MPALIETPTPNRTLEDAIRAQIRVVTDHESAGIQLIPISRIFVGSTHHATVRGFQRGDDLGAWRDGEHISDALPSYLTTHHEVTGWLVDQIVDQLVALHEAYAEMVGEMAG